MVTHMKTTFNIDDNLMQQLREEAARRKTTMTSLVEAGLRRVLDETTTRKHTSEELPPLPSKPMGITSVDVANRNELFRIFDEEKPPWL